MRTRPAEISVRRRFVLLVLPLLVAACAPRVNLGVTEVRGTPRSPAIEGEPSAPVDSGAATVSIRYFRFSPHVAVLGWDANDASYGLRSVIRRDGTLLVDHQFYVDAYQFPTELNVVGAEWEAFAGDATTGRALQYTGVARDDRNCMGDVGCSPYRMLTVRLPEAYLRSTRDSVTIRIRARNGLIEQLVLQRDVIDTYLTKVAEVSTAIRATN